MATLKDSGPEVLVVHFAVGLDLIGAKTSLHTSKYHIVATAIGIAATSRTTNRTIVVPYSNVKGFELMPEGGLSSIKAPAQQRADQALREAREAMEERGEEVVPPPAPNKFSDAQLQAQAAEARKAAKAAAKKAAQEALVQEQAKTAALQSQK